VRLRARTTVADGEVAEYDAVVVEIAAAQEEQNDQNVGYCYEIRRDLVHYPPFLL
jgi:hypothetical protein